MEASAFFLHYGGNSFVPVMMAAVILPVPAAFAFASVFAVVPPLSAFFVGAVARVITSAVDDGLQDAIARGCRVLCICRKDAQTAHDNE